MPTCYVPITVRLSGDPAGVADDDVTAAVERAVVERLATVRRELARRGASGWGASIVVGEPASAPAEPVDPERAGRGAYELPSYQGGGERTRLPVQSADPVLGAQRALARIHRQLETGLFDWFVTDAEARAVLRILLALPFETLLRTVQVMRLGNAWRTFRRELGDLDLDAQIELDMRLDPNVGWIGPGDRVLVEILESRRAGVDRTLSQEYEVTHGGVRLAALERPVSIVGMQRERAADVIATAYFDALVLSNPFVRLSVVFRGSLFAPRHGRVNPIPVLSRVTFAQSPRGQRLAAFADYVAMVDLRDPFVGRALGHYLSWIERNRDSNDLLTRTPVQLWGWALQQAGTPPPESALEPFLRLLRLMSARRDDARGEERNQLNTTITRYLAWLDRHRNDPDLARENPGNVWARLAVGVHRDEIRQSVDRARREAAERRPPLDLDAISRKLDEAERLAQTRLLRVREPQAIDVPSKGIGYLIWPSEAERRLRSELGRGFLSSVYGRITDPDFTRTSAAADLSDYLAANPELTRALELATTYPDVEHYTVTVDVPAWQTAIEVGVGFIPIVGQIVAAGEVATGYSITGRGLGTLERGILAAGVLLPAAARLGRLGYASVATVRVARDLRMTAAEAEAFFRATARIQTGSAGNRLLSRAVDDVRAGRPIDQRRVNELQTLTRQMGLTEASTAQTLAARGSGRGPLADATDSEIEGAIEAAFSPRVTGGRTRPRIEGIPVPRRQVARLDIDDIARAAGETQAQALARVGRVISRRLDQTPLAPAWNAARERVLAGRPLSSVTRDEMLGVGRSESLYDRVRNEFWDEVRRRPDAITFLTDSGFDLSRGRAPMLRVNRPGIPDHEIRVSLDHNAEKALGENWRRAIDVDNFTFEFQSPNSYREIVQARFRMRTGTPDAAMPGSGPPPPGAATPPPGGGTP